MTDAAITQLFPVADRVVDAKAALAAVGSGGGRGGFNKAKKAVEDARVKVLNDLGLMLNFFGIFSL